MVHFDFILQDAEAELLFDCVDNQMHKLHNSIMDMQTDSGYRDGLPPTVIAEINSLNDCYELLGTLKAKMRNTRP
jgi:hypothetical protein